MSCRKQRRGNPVPEVISELLYQWSTSIQRSGPSGCGLHERLTALVCEPLSFRNPKSENRIQLDKFYKEDYGTKMTVSMVIMMICFLFLFLFPSSFYSFVSLHSYIFLPLLLSFVYVLWFDIYVFLSLLHTSISFSPFYVVLPFDHSYFSLFPFFLLVILPFPSWFL